MIDLVERFRRDLETHTEKLVPDESSSEFVDRFFAEDHGIGTCIDVDQHRLDGRVHFEKDLDKTFLAGKYRRCQNEHHHDLSRCESFPEKYAAQKSLPGPLIVGTDLKADREFTNVREDLRALFILEKTVIVFNDLMGTFRITAGDKMRTDVTECPVDLVSIIHRILRTGDRADRADRR